MRRCRPVEGHDVSSRFGIGRILPVAPRSVFRLPDARRRGTCPVAHGAAQLPKLLAAELQAAYSSETRSDLRAESGEIEGRVAAI
jgi:hypothetical protein